MFEPLFIRTVFSLCDTWKLYGFKGLELHSSVGDCYRLRSMLPVFKLMLSQKKSDLSVNTSKPIAIARYAVTQELIAPT